MNKTEQDLFAKYLELILKELYKSHFEKLYYTTKGYVANEKAANEIINESFLKVSAELSKLLNASNVAGMLDNFTRKGCQAYLHDQEVYTNEEYYFQKKQNSYNPEYFGKSNDREELYPIVRDAVKCLPPQRKAIILYIYWEGLTSDEIASKMGLARQTVLNQKTKALHWLKSVMSKYLI